MTKNQQNIKITEQNYYGTYQDILWWAGDDRMKNNIPHIVNKSLYIP